MIGQSYDFQIFKRYIRKSKIWAVSHVRLSLFGVVSMLCFQIIIIIRIVSFSTLTTVLNHQIFPFRMSISLKSLVWVIIASPSNDLVGNFSLIFIKLMLWILHYLRTKMPILLKTAGRFPHVVLYHMQIYGITYIHATFFCLQLNCIYIQFYTEFDCLTLFVTSKFTRNM